MEKKRLVWAVLMVVAVMGVTAIASADGTAVWPSGNNPKAPYAPINGFCDCYQAILDNSLMTLLPMEFANLLKNLTPGMGDINGDSTIDLNGWIGIDPDNPVSTGTSDRKTIKVEYKYSDRLPAGTYNGTITIIGTNQANTAIAAINSPLKIPITLTIGSKAQGGGSSPGAVPKTDVIPIIGCSVSSLTQSTSVGVKAADQTFEVWNDGTGTLACNILNIDFSVGGNGLLDCNVELKLVEEVLRNTAFSLPNGLTHAAVHKAWNDNDAQFALDIGSYWGLLGSLANGLGQTLKGFMIVGDGSATFSLQKPIDVPPPNPPKPAEYWHIETSGFAGFCQSLMGLLGGMIPNPYINLNNYNRMPQYFALDGDADGDGCTNLQEWLHYGTPGGGSIAAYVSAALDPAKHDCGGGQLAGDVNCDGEVTPGDAQAVFDHFLGLNTPECLQMGDVCPVGGDGQYTSGDAQGIFNMFLGLPAPCDK